MPQAVPLTGLNRAWRWARIGAAVGIVLLVITVIAGLTPLAVWEGRGILFNIGIVAGAVIGGAFCGLLVALIRHAAVTR